MEHWEPAFIDKRLRVRYGRGEEPTLLIFHTEILPIFDRYILYLHYVTFPLVIQHNTNQPTAHHMGKVAQEN